MKKEGRKKPCGYSWLNFNKHFWLRWNPLSFKTLSWFSSHLQIWQRPGAIRLTSRWLPHRGTRWLRTHVVPRTHHHSHKVPQSELGVRYSPAASERHRGKLCGVQPSHWCRVSARVRWQVGEEADCLCDHWLGHHRYVSLQVRCSSPHFFDVQSVCLYICSFFFTEQKM